MLTIMFLLFVIVIVAMDRLPCPSAATQQLEENRFQPVQLET
jgi:hypothetical protein